MTEYDWLTSSDPDAMLSFLRDSGKVGERKLRLFGLACCRRVWHWLTDERSRRAVEVAEQFTNVVGPAEHVTGVAEVMLSWDKAGADALPFLSQPYQFATGYAKWAVTTTGEQGRRAAEREAQAALLRDIFGNPFRLVTLHPPCLTEEVVALARDIYDSQSFDKTPTLAAALEQVGCDDAAVLDHLAAPGEHVRGCFAVDLVLGRQ